MRIARLTALCTLVLTLAACGDEVAPGSSAQVSLSFVSASPDAALSPAMAEAGMFGAVDAQGSNGILTIDEVQIVVDEFKLERTEGSCEVEAQEECATFELPPYFLDLPLTEVPVDVGAASVDEGTYATLKLETKDLVSSAGDDGSELEDLGETVRAAYPEWPDDASLRVAGSFDADDGSEPVPFVAYFRAEVKVEMVFETPLALEADDEVGVAVEIDPLAWFALTDGTVEDLSAFDYGTTGEVVDLEAKMADGFTKIEVGG